MDPIILTVILASLIGLAFGGVVAKMIIDKKRGKHFCFCGGNCSSCGICSTQCGVKSSEEDE